MPRYLVEVSEPKAIAAKRISRSVSTLGSHFATHADWRHQNGVSTGTLIVDVDNEWSALGVVPPAMRSDAQIFQLESVSAGVRSSAPSVHPVQPYAVAA
jgi:hypothetical protein